MSKGKVPVKKILSIICTVITALIVVLAAIVIINMQYCRAKNKPVSFFGTSFAIVQTPSMEPDIMTGDLIVFHQCSYDDIKEGDYIVFIAGDGFGSMKGQSIVHEAKKITPDGIITQGTNNDRPDSDKVTSGNLLGICTFNSAGWGKFFRFINKYGILLVIALVAVPFIVKQIIKIVKLSREKQAEEANATDTGGKEITEKTEDTEDIDEKEK